VLQSTLVATWNQLPPDASLASVNELNKMVELANSSMLQRVITFLFIKIILNVKLEVVSAKRLHRKYFFGLTGIE
jgi:hypothetical protein